MQELELRQEQDKPQTPRRREEIKNNFKNKNII